MTSKKKDPITHPEEEMSDYLHEYTVKYPSEQEIKQTIQALHQYIPEKQREKVPIYHRLHDLMQKIFLEISTFSKSYWIVSVFLYIVGYLFTSYASKDYLLLLTIITPLPFIFGLFEVFKGRESGVLELEMACKYSAYQVMLSRLLLISLYNIGLSLGLSLITSLKLAIPIWEIILIWFAPFTVFAAICLWLSARFRNTSFTVLLISCWVIFSLFFLTFDSLINLGNYILIFRHICLLVLGVYLCYRQIKNIIFTYQSFDRGDPIETSY